jgi:argininosuccinate synthase
MLRLSRATPAATRCVRAYSTDFNKVSFREPDPSKPKLVLAYSGGLDTSTQLAYLTQEMGFEVCAYIADLGQDDLKTQEDKDAVRDKAQESGAYAYYCEDQRREFVTDFVFEQLRAHAVYERRYLMGTCVARPCIGKRQVEVCWNEGATHISHGSTGKGNDQVRFEMCYLGMDPTLECVTLWREPDYCAKFPGRQELLEYATSHGIKVTATKKHSYSEDENMMHISYESGELEDPAYPGHNEEYPGMVLKKKSVDIIDCPDEPANLTIGFEKGTPVYVKNVDDGTEYTDPLGLFLYLNEIGGAHGVGRLDIVENRFVGMKSRGCYETPAGTILYSAKLDLEMLTMDREVMRIRDTLSDKYAEICYNGGWYSPEWQMLTKSMEFANQNTTGEAYVRLHKANVLNRGRYAGDHSLYNEDLVSMDMLGGFDPSQSTGFIRTLSTRIKASKARDAKLSK